QIALPLVTWKYAQPYTFNLSSHPSVVRDCQGSPVQFAPVAMDDWICTRTGPIVRVDWWGTSPQPNQQPAKRFYIAIYNDVQCRPANLVYSTCVNASFKPVTVDCAQRRVYRFRAPIAGFSQVAGTHYWLQISEVDGVAGAPSSPTPNAIDFQWSAHREIKNCPAGRRAPSGAWFAPLIDSCDQREDDLAFVLFSSTIRGTIPFNPAALNPALPAHSITVEVRRPGSGELLWSQSVTPDDDGSFAAEPEVPAGNYRVGVRVPGCLPSYFDVTIGDDSDVDLGGINVAVGDVNGDGRVNFQDISVVLSGWAP
ncbi:MAG: hypothetical protein SFZ24_10565, partial [Planctomycetota bacterium]|nr:hypothetical protein [Planctomycetota bacterium]